MTPQHQQQGPKDILQNEFVGFCGDGGMEQAEQAIPVDIVHPVDTCFAVICGPTGPRQIGFDAKLV